MTPTSSIESNNAPKHDEEVTKALATTQKLGPPKLQNNEVSGLLIYWRKI